MERTITLGIDKAREFYLSGNRDLKALALSAFSEDELVVAGLPTSVGEFTEKYGCTGFLSPREIDEYEAHAMLRKLRDLYRGCDEDEYRERLGGGKQYCITKMYRGGVPSYQISDYYSFYSEFLSFTERSVAEKFLACFEGLIEKAGYLI